jgi:hypothetical protein
MPTFPNKLKLLCVIGWCIVAYMISESDVSSLNLPDAIYQNKLQSTPISRLRPMGATREGEC